MTAFEIRALDAAEAVKVPAVWNAAWGKQEQNPYPLTPRLWQERLASRHHDPALLLGAFADGELAAVAHGKLPRSPWQSADACWVSLVAVAPPHQHRGLGTHLLAQLLSLLADRGATVIRFGGDADHVLPGPPQESKPAVWRLLRRFGARFGAAEHDLLLDLRRELPAAPLPPGWRLTYGDARGAAAVTTRLFPGRWSEEVADYAAAGAVPVILEQFEPVGGERPAEDGREPATAVGFCAMFRGDEAVTSPGLHWGQALERELEAATGGPVRLAGIGPLGIDASVRGSGLGLALVRGAAEHLRERGATDVIINWTGLTGFYGRLGARLCRSYQRAEATMPPPETLAALAAASGLGAQEPAGGDSR